MFTRPVFRTTIAIGLIGLFLSACGGGSSSGGGGGNPPPPPALSDDADLSSISFSALTLNESYDPQQTNYSAEVSYGVGSTMVTFVTSDSDIGAAQLNGMFVPESTESEAIDLAVGSNTITIKVTALDGVTTKTYTITVTRNALVNNHSPEYIVFKADKDADEVFGLYSVLDDGSAEPINLLDGFPSFTQVEDFFVSPDNTHVAFTINGPDGIRRNLYVAPIQGGTRYLITDVIKQPTTQIKSAAWSPDSTKIIFLADIDTENMDELHMANRDGTDLHKINGFTSGVVEIGDYAWSPDGHYVVYKVYNLNQPSQVIGINSHVVGTVSGQTGYSVRLNPTLTSGGSLKDFAWSSNSTNVAYLADQETPGENELYISSANLSQMSTKASHDLDTGSNVSEFSWSYDGSLLAYLATTASTAALYTSTSDVATKGQLVSQSLPGDIHSFAWSPVANQLLYMADTGEAYELFLSAGDGSNIGLAMSDALVNAGTSRSGSVLSFAWSPDGSRVAYRADQETADVAELFLSAANRGFIGDKISAALRASGDVLDFAWSPDSNRLAYRAAGAIPGVVGLYVSTVDGAAIGQQVSSRNVPDHADIGVYKYAWASDSEALTYRGAETTPGVVELYASLANGHIRGASLSGPFVNGGDVAIAAGISELFSDGSWLVPFKISEMCAMDYDAVADAIFIIKCTQARNNKVLRYSFATKALTQVYEFDSQLDYGARIIDGELFIAGTYREAILHLTDLDKPQLTEVGNYFANQNEEALNEVTDIAVVDDDIYFVAGNYLTSAQHDGIQRIGAPNYNAVTEFLSETEAGWPVAQKRSILSTGSAANVEFVVTTGFNGALERRDIDGNLLASIPGFGSSILQKDSEDNIYTAYTSRDNSSITYWKSDLSNETVLPFTSDLISGDNSLLVIRESGAKLIAYITSFRSRDPRFEEIVLVE